MQWLPSSTPQRQCFDRLRNRRCQSFQPPRTNASQSIEHPGKEGCYLPRLWGRTPPRSCCPHWWVREKLFHRHSRLHLIASEFLGGLRHHLCYIASSTAHTRRWGIGFSPWAFFQTSSASFWLSTRRSLAPDPASFPPRRRFSRRGHVEAAGPQT